MRRGFTLIELLVVIAIIGILAGVVLASLNSARLKSRETARVAQLNQVKTAIEMHFIDNGHYPLGPSTCTPLHELTELEPYININSVRDPVHESLSTGFRYARMNNGNGYAIRVTFEDTSRPGTNESGQCITGNNFGTNPCNWGLGSYVCQGI